MHSVIEISDRAQHVVRATALGPGSRYNDAASETQIRMKTLKLEGCMRLAGCKITPSTRLALRPVRSWLAQDRLKAHFNEVAMLSVSDVSNQGEYQGRPTLQPDSHAYMGPSRGVACMGRSSIMRTNIALKEHQSCT